MSAELQQTESEGLTTCIATCGRLRIGMATTVVAGIIQIPAFCDYRLECDA
jgi:hypothetical protein